MQVHVFFVFGSAFITCIICMYHLMYIRLCGYQLEGMGGPESANVCRTLQRPLLGHPTCRNWAGQAALLATINGTSGDFANCH